MKISFTRFADKHATGKVYNIEWKDFVNKLINTTNSLPKDQQPMLTGAIFKDNIPSSENLISTQLIIGDIDKVRVPIDDIKDRLTTAGLSAFVHTSASHTEKRTSCRVILPLESPISPDAYGDYVDMLNGALGGILAPESADPARRYFYGKSKVNDTEVPYQTVITEGLALDGMDYWEQPDKVFCRPKKQLTPTNDANWDRLTLTDEQVLDLRKGLEFLANKGHATDYAQWVSVGHDLYPLGEVGYDLWLEFSCLSLDHNPHDNIDKFRKTWDSFHGTHSGYANVFTKCREYRDWFNPATSRAKPKEQTKGFKLTALSDYPDDDPPESWLIRGVLPEGKVGFMNGDSASGKSFIAIDMAWAIAHGQDWCGNRVKSKGDVVYVAGEDSLGVRKRFLGLAKKDALPRADNIYLSDKGLSLFNHNDAELLLDSISGVTSNPKLIIVDTFHRNFGGDENSATDVKVFFDNIEEVQRRTSATILVIHHTGHNAAGRARGSSSIKASLDFEFLVSRDKEDKKIINLEFTKTKNQAGGDEKTLQFILTEITTGRVDIDDDLEFPEMTAYLDYQGHAVKAISQKLSSDEQKLLDIAKFVETDSFGVLPANDEQIRRRPDLLDEFGAIKNLIPIEDIKEAAKNEFPESSFRQRFSKLKLSLVQKLHFFEIDNCIVLASKNSF